MLPTQAPLDSQVLAISATYDTTINDKNDTILLNELFCNRADVLITEDRKIHRKATALGIDTRVFTIDSFLEKVTAENPSLLEYKIPTIKKAYFGNVDLKDEFFNTLKTDYAGFEKWFNGKSDEFAYVSGSDEKTIAFLYLKLEDKTEPYPDIQPQFSPRKRLKIGTFKVQLNGFKIGERFLKIIFDNASHLKVEEIYVTIFKERLEQSQLVSLLEDYGFNEFGTKRSSSGTETVYVKDFTSKASLSNPKLTYPFMSRKARKFLIPIYPEYHTNLFPDSILRTESPLEFIEQEPFRNAISKVYVSRSIKRDLKIGDILVFYRTGGFYKSVITTLGIVDGIHTSIPDCKTFVDLCRKRSVFSDKELKAHWEYNPTFRPFVVDFLYTYSFPKRINMQKLIELGVISDVNSAPRGFEPITDKDFENIIRETGTDGSIIVD